MNAVAAGSEPARPTQARAASEIAAARALAVQGVKLAQAGRCTEALSSLTRAEQLYHSPVVLSYAAQCYAALGRFVEASEAAIEVKRERVTGTTAPVVLLAKDRAQRVYDAVKDQVAALRVMVTTREPVDVVVQVDGRIVPLAALGAGYPVDPGTRRVTVQASGYLDSQYSIELHRGASRELQVHLEPRPGVARVRPASSVSRQSVTVNDAGTSSSWSSTPAFVSFGVALVGVGVGAGFGISAARTKESLQDRCPGNVCPPEASDQLQLARRQANAATVGFGVGALGAAVGTFLFVLSTPRDESSPAVTAAVGPGNVSVRAHF